MKPFESKGCSVFGASMGRRSESLEGLEGRARLARVPACDGGDYDPGGAYWGGLWASPLWCAWGETAEEQREHYVRAPSREAAKAALRARFPALKFYR